MLSLVWYLLVFFCCWAAGFLSRRATRQNSMTFSCQRFPCKAHFDVQEPCEVSDMYVTFYRFHGRHVSNKWMRWLCSLQTWDTHRYIRCTVWFREMVVTLHTSQYAYHGCYKATYIETQAHTWAVRFSHNDFVDLPLMWESSYVTGWVDNYAFDIKIYFRFWLNSFKSVL